MDTPEQDRPRLGLWNIDTLKGAGPNGHALYQITRNDAPFLEPFLYRRDANREMMRAVRAEGLAVQEYMRSNRQSIIREALQSS